jgi:4a-hydroxytetrahydrobiopterin dehydratase
MKWIKKFNETIEGEWSDIEDVLQRTYIFSDFIEVQEFINKIVPICQIMNHHPDIEWNYNKLTLKLITHDVGKVTELDYQLAKKIESIYQTF